MVFALESLLPLFQVALTLVVLLLSLLASSTTSLTFSEDSSALLTMRNLLPPVLRILHLQSEATLPKARGGIMLLKHRPVPLFCLFVLLPNLALRPGALKLLRFPLPTSIQMSLQVPSLLVIMTMVSPNLPPSSVLLSPCPLRPMTTRQCPVCLLLTWMAGCPTLLMSEPLIHLESRYRSQLLPTTPLSPTSPPPLPLVLPSSVPLLSLSEQLYVHSFVC